METQEESMPLGVIKRAAVYRSSPDCYVKQPSLARSLSQGQRLPRLLMQMCRSLVRSATRSHSHHGMLTHILVWTRLDAAAGAASEDNRVVCKHDPITSMTACALLTKLYRFLVDKHSYGCWLCVTGVEGAVVVGKLLERNAEADYGYNAASNTYQDLVKAGIIDPLKVQRHPTDHCCSPIAKQ